MLVLHHSFLLKFHALLTWKSLIFIEILQNLTFFSCAAKEQ